MRAFKGFNKDLTCRGYQYEEGKEFHTERAECCDTGFHACEYPLDCFGYYDPAHSVFHEVELSGEMDKSGDNTKVCATDIKIGARLSIAGLVKMAIDFTMSKVNKEAGSDERHGFASATGDCGASSATGYKGASWHTERMEAEGVTDLFNPYQNIRVGLNCLREIQDKYLASSGENCVLMVYNIGESTAKKLWAKDIYSSAYSREVIARAQELRQELTQE